MCHSYINAADKFDFQLKIAAPEGFEPNADLLNTHKSRVQLSRDPKSAVQDADLVVTDVWASMGQEEEQNQRITSFAGYQVNEELMSLGAIRCPVYALPARTQGRRSKRLDSGCRR